MDDAMIKMLCFYVLGQAAASVLWDRAWPCGLQYGRADFVVRCCWLCHINSFLWIFDRAVLSFKDLS